MIIINCNLLIKKNTVDFSISTVLSKYVSDDSTISFYYSCMTLESLSETSSGKLTISLKIHVLNIYRLLNHMNQGRITV